MPKLLQWAPGQQELALAAGSLVTIMSGGLGVGQAAGRRAALLPPRNTAFNPLLRAFSRRRISRRRRLGSPARLLAAAPPPPPPLPQPTASSAASCRATRAPSARWRSAATAHCWPLGRRARALTSGCGTTPAAAAWRCSQVPACLGQQGLGARPRWGRLGGGDPVEKQQPRPLTSLPAFLQATAADWPRWTSPRTAGRCWRWGWTRTRGSCWCCGTSRRRWRARAAPPWCCAT
jgi:hypothetical protein